MWGSATVIALVWAFGMVPTADGAAAAPPEPECSCDAPLADLVGRAAVAFIGTPTGSELDPEDDPRNPSVFLVNVDRPIKGDIEPEAEVDLLPSALRCGAFLRLGSTVGIIAGRDEDQLTVSGCGAIVDADDLRDLVEATLPAPTGEGAVAALVGARAGPAGVLAVDAGFRPLGYVPLSGDAVAAALCPSGTAAVVVTVDGLGATVHRVDLVSLRVNGSRPLPGVDATAARIFCTGDTGEAAVFAAGLLHRVPLDAEVVVTPMRDAVDVVALPLGTFVLTERGVRLVTVDGARAGDLTTFPQGTTGLSMVVDAWDLVVAVASDPALGPGVANALMRISLIDESTTTQLLTTVVPGPVLRSATTGVVVRSVFVPGETWLAADGAVLATSETNLWPAGDGHLSWTGTEITAVIGGEQSPALELASAVSFVVPVASGVTVDPAAPGAQPMPMVPTRGRTILPPAPSTNAAPSSTVAAPSTTDPADATSTTVASAADDDEGLGSSTLFAAALVAGIAAVLVAAAIALRRRPLPATPKEPGDP